MCSLFCISRCTSDLRGTMQIRLVGLFLSFRLMHMEFVIIIMQQLASITTSK